MPKNLTISGKDKRWVDKTLRNYPATVESTYLLTVDANNQIIWFPKE